MKKRFRSATGKLLALCMVVLLLPVTAMAAPTSFADVPATAYYKDSVSWAVEKGITNGTTATTFSPDNTCTRAQILTFLWRAAGSPALKNHAGEFVDVKETDYFYTAAHWAVENNIIALNGNRFDPSTPCTRAATVEYIWKYAGAPAAEGAAFTDVAANTELATAVSWAVKNGVTKGTTTTTFSPANTCTRAQIVTFLYRAFADGNKLPESSQTTKPGDSGYEEGGWKGDDYGSNEDVIGDATIAGQFVDNKDFTREFYKSGMNAEDARQALNRYIYNVYSRKFFADGIKKNATDAGKFARFVTHSDGRLGIQVFQWRKSYDSGSSTNTSLNAVMEAVYFFTKDKDVAYALFSWIDAKNINGRANSDDFGFRDVTWSNGSGVITMNGINIEVDNSTPGQTIYYFNK